MLLVFGSIDLDLSFRCERLPLPGETMLANEGVAARAGGQTLQLPAFAVQALDTTGAGDTFAGVFTAAWAEGQPLREALALASAAAALACTHWGAQVAQPTRADIESALAGS